MPGKIATALLLVLLLTLPSWAQEQLSTLGAMKLSKNSVDVKKWRARAKKGDPIAQFNLGLMYDAGSGVEQNYVRAVLWYRKAALKGVADAQNNLAVMYDNGFGVPHDPAKAFWWFRQAAKSGHAEAQNNLGIMYENGSGVEQDISKALFWYRKAARHGHKDAKKNLRSILAKSRGGVTKAPSASRDLGDHIQLGSFKSKIQAEKEAVRLAKIHGSVLGNMKIRVVPIDLGKRGTFYRLKAGPLINESADKVCQTLFARKQDCLVVGP